MKPYFKQRLKRDKQNKMIAGVCSGMAEYFNIDPVIVRLVFALGLFIPSPTFLIIYIILWIVTPYNDIEIKNYKSEKYSNEK